MHRSKIFLVDKSGQTWLPMTEMPYDQEVVLQEALAQYPDLIPGDQIDPDNPRRWLLVQAAAIIPTSRRFGTSGSFGDTHAQT